LENRTVAFHTLGCKLNFAETSTLARQLKNSGFSKVDFSEMADIYVINTCSVTDNADKETKSIVRRAKKLNPQALVAITGCYAQLKPEQVAAIDGVNLVLGAKEKFNIDEYLSKLLAQEKIEKIHSCEIEETKAFTAAWSEGDRTRTFLKIQDGCDFPCTYCTIPLARGKSRSGSIQQVLDQVKDIAKKGIKEIVLTGLNTGDYGIDPETGKRTNTFLELITALDKVESIERFRISSIEPNLIHDEVIYFIAHSKKFVPHFHIPLQSGCDKILKLMRRRYTASLYRDRVKLIKELMPHASIGADVITGFPGETVEDHNTTLAFIQSLPVSYLHVFTYSSRSNTPAATMAQQVDAAEKKNRTASLRTLSAKLENYFYESQRSTKVNVLFESENKNGFIAGYSENYIRVTADFNQNLVGKLVAVTLDNRPNAGSYHYSLENKI
jgi:threonylcarbamoyladenosine tRNA methylthiotransferase MtaB